MILRVTPTKTEQTSAASIEVDLSECPMVVEELSKIPLQNRLGPLIVNPITGLPYRQWYFRDLWRKCARVSGISDTVWNRDLRAGGGTASRSAAGRPKESHGPYGSVEATATNWKRHDGCQGREWPTGQKT